MNKNNIICDLLFDLSGKRVSEDENLIETGVLDSISRVDFALILEKQFNITIPFSYINSETFHSVSRIVKMIENL
jgi:acyl carrier protein